MDNNFFGRLPSCLLLCAVAASAVPTVPWRVACPPRCVCQIRPWYTPRSAYREAATVDCNDLFITAVPRELPEGTQTLLLQSNNIARLQRGELGYLRNLSELDLSQNSFSRARDFGLGAMPQLLSLHLEENQLAELPDGSFPGLGNLQELYLNHNRLRSIAPRAFAGLGNLLRLHLNSNLLRALDSRWFLTLPSLEILMLGGNRVDAIPDMNFRPLGNLRSLVLAGMHLREIADAALEGLRSLESLSFYDNELAAVPRRALQRVPGLKFLDLNKNPLQRVRQSDFADMLHLKELGLNNMDELVSIDRLALSNLPELTKLDVTNNPKLSFIHPEAFRQLPRLETLMLNNNALSALHRRTVESLPGLREIGIHGNPAAGDWQRGNPAGWAGAAAHVTMQRVSSPDTITAHRAARKPRDVPFGDMTEQCLPLISPGARVALHCRALAEPEPDIYWVTPAGEKLLPGGGDERFRVHPEGTLEIRGVAAHEAGLYTCVAHNLLGADTRSVRLLVNRSFPLGPERLQLLLLDVQPHHVLLAWRPRLNALSSNLTWSVSEPGTAASSARIPAGTHSFNITRLSAGTEYRACLTVCHLPRWTFLVWNTRKQQQTKKKNPKKCLFFLWDRRGVWSWVFGSARTTKMPHFHLRGFGVKNPRNGLGWKNPGDPIRL
uniref:Leucine rich repeat neuronal 2 n=1 Tax=Malurus cyaneus samueli TaxID=2593467 RepID=A0A8C5THV3_9PASS